MNDNPVANTDSATIPEDSAATAINVLANDTIAPTPAKRDGDGGLAGCGKDVHGTGVSYTPELNYNGPDSFTYAIADGNGGAAKATVTVTVTPVNDNPVANPDAATILEDNAGTAIDVLANDSIVPDVKETLTVTAVTQGLHGKVTFTATGVSYTPELNYNGPDGFTYTITDGNGGSATGKVSVTVTPVNDNPVANADALTVLEDALATPVNVLANDSIAPDTGETLTVTAVSLAAHGSVTFTATAVSYTPAAAYNGPDEFTYTIADGNGGSATAKVTVTVTRSMTRRSFEGRRPGVAPERWSADGDRGHQDQRRSERIRRRHSRSSSADNPALFTVQPAIAPNGTPDLDAVSDRHRQRASDGGTQGRRRYGQWRSRHQSRTGVRDHAARHHHDRDDDDALVADRKSDHVRPGGGPECHGDRRERQAGYGVD
jgi:hypothetical protein